MTVSTTATSSPIYVGNDVTTAFPTTFMFLDNDTVIPVLIVGVVETDLVTGFTVTGTGVESGGTVTLTAPLATGTSLRIDRRTPLTQPVSIRNLGYFAPDVHEEAWNRSTMQLQELNATKLDRDGVVAIVEEAGVQVDGLLRTDLASPNAPYGSQLVAFKQSGTGAVARTSQSKMRDTVNVFDFMSSAQIADTQLATPVLDHTAAIQAAATACAVGGINSVLEFPKGKFNISAAINVQFSGTVRGAGKQDTIIRKTVAGINHFYTAGSFGQVEFCNFGLETTVVANGGAGILVDTPSPTDGAQTGTRIHNIRCLDLYDGFRLPNAAYWVISDNLIFGTLNNSIYADCTQNYDAGDNAISRNTIVGAGNGGAGVYLVNNCRVTDNKILNHGKGIVVAPNAVAGTRVDYQIIGNSIENFLTHGIQFSVTNAGTGIANSIIAQNQIAAFQASGQCIALNGSVGGISINNNVCVLIGNSTVGIATVGNGTGAPGTAIINDNIVTGGPAGSIGIYAGGANTIIDNNLVPSATQLYDIAAAGVTIRNTELTFAQMTGFGTAAANGSVVYCSNGTIANPVASGGTGCIAKRLNGVWVGN